MDNIRQKTTSRWQHPSKKFLSMTSVTKNITAVTSVKKKIMLITPVKKNGPPYTVVFLTDVINISFFFDGSYRWRRFLWLKASWSITNWIFPCTLPTEQSWDLSQKVYPLRYHAAPNFFCVLLRHIQHCPSNCTFWWICMPSVKKLSQRMEKSHSALRGFLQSACGASTSIVFLTLRPVIHQNLKAFHQMFFSDGGCPWKQEN